MKQDGQVDDGLSTQRFLGWRFEERERVKDLRGVVFQQRLGDGAGLQNSTRFK